MPAIHYPYITAFYFGFYQSWYCLPKRHSFARRSTHYRNGMHCCQQEISLYLYKMGRAAPARGVPHP
uniref:Uncharacterized protein n=1 Tax=Siphoviridae sp. ctjdk2 TaxID=2825635 RepID=A0A8S5UKT0_9CAUD|nr:MAG TPA: hypothetical protein [Siphoviridae sp. ctjdk2]